MKKKYRGSYTIECALVLPIVMVVIISLVWLLIYMYDKVVIEANLIHGLIAVDYDCTANNNKLKEEIEERINENIWNDTVAIKEIQISVVVTKFSCTAKACGIIDIPEGIPVLSKLSVLNVEVSKKRYSGTETIKEMRRLQKLADLLKETEDSSEGGIETRDEQALPDFGNEIIGLQDSNGMQ